MSTKVTYPKNIGKYGWGAVYNISSHLPATVTAPHWFGVPARGSVGVHPRWGLFDTYVQFDIDANRNLLALCSFTSGWFCYLTGGADPTFPYKIYVSNQPFWWNGQTPWAGGGQAPGSYVFDTAVFPGSEMHEGGSLPVTDPWGGYHPLISGDEEKWAQGGWRGECISNLGNIDMFTKTEERHEQEGYIEVYTHVWISGRAYFDGETQMQYPESLELKIPSQFIPLYYYPCSVYNGSRFVSCNDTGHSLKIYKDSTFKDVKNRYGKADPTDQGHIYYDNKWNKIMKG